MSIMPDDTTTVVIAGQARRVETVSARKASRAFALLRAINGRAKDLSKRIDKFERDYRAEHVLELTRVEARVRFPPQVVLDPETGAPVREPDTLPNPRAGELRDPAGTDRPAGVELDTIPNPRAGELVTFPSPVDRMSEDDWQTTGGLYPIHERAPFYAVAMFAFEDALEVAEEHVYRLLALLLMSNDDVTRRHKDNSLADELDAAAEKLLDDAMADEVLEVAVVCAEVLDRQFRHKLDTLGGRAGNLLRLFGLGPATTTSSSTPPNGRTDSTPTSSTDSPSSSEPDGAPTPSSTATIGSSSESESSPTPTEPEPTPEPLASA